MFSESVITIEKIHCLQVIRDTLRVVHSVAVYSFFAIFSLLCNSSNVGCRITCDLCLTQALVGQSAGTLPLLLLKLWDRHLGF